MFCRHCGGSVDTQRKFCPDCGSRLADQDPQQAPPKKHHSFFWLKTLLSMIALVVFAFVAVGLLSEDITDVVTEQLNAIQQGNLTEAYYNYTSKAFQNATPLASFREFLNAYPEFSHSKSVRFIDRSVDGDAGVLQAKLTTAQGVEAPVQYTFAREGDKWKIVNIKFESNQPEGTAEPFDQKPLENIVQGQLDLIRQHKLQEAYDGYASAAFKKVTSFKEFEEFVRDEPILVDNVSSDIHKLSFDNNTASLSGTLKAKDGDDYPVNFDLVQEKGEWKVLHIEVGNPVKAKAEAGAAMKISNYVLGSTVDSSGIIFDPKTSFNKDSGDIYLNLHLTGAKAGAAVEVTLEYVPSKAKIPPVATRITDNGDATVMFIFSPPKNGWPIGMYRIHVKTSTGLTDSYDFKVEEG